MKSIKCYGARAKLETAYGTFSSPANTDGLLLDDLPLLKLPWANEGQRPMPSATMGFAPRVAPSGQSAETTLKVAPRGAGSAYSSTNLPNCHPLLRALGFDAVVTTTSGAERVDYTPSPGPVSFASISLDLFERQQQYSLAGVLGDFVFGANGPEVPVIEAAIKGLLHAFVSDVALPNITYGAASGLQPTKSVDPVFTFNGVSGLYIKSWQLKKNRTLKARIVQNVGGHAGFAVQADGPTLEFTVEAPDLSVIDFYALKRSAALCAFSIAPSATSYNGWKVTGPAAQVIDVSDEADDPTATLKVMCQLNPSAFGLRDEFTLTFF